MLLISQHESQIFVTYHYPAQTISSSFFWKVWSSLRVHLIVCLD